MDDFENDLVTLLPRLRRFARSLVRNADDSDDLVQLAVERALARRGQWKPGTNLASWMFTLMKNAWIDDARGRARWSKVLRPPEFGEKQAGDSTDPESRIAIQDALDRLPADQRLAVALVLVEGLSYEEASRVLEVPTGTLTSRLVRGRMALMAHLEREA